MVIRSVKRKASGLLALIDNWNEHPLISTGVLFIGITIVSSGAMCLIEPSTFDTYWKSVWFTLITITTVGYGDLVPKSFPGQAFAVFVMLSGIGLFAGYAAVINERIHEVALRRNALNIGGTGSDQPFEHLLLEEIIALRRDAEQQTAAIEELRAELQRVRTELTKFEKRH